VNNSQSKLSTSEQLAVQRLSRRLSQACESVWIHACQRVYANAARGFTLRRVLHIVPISDRKRRCIRPCGYAGYAWFGVITNCSLIVSQYCMLENLNSISAKTLKIPIIHNYSIIRIQSFTNHSLQNYQILIDRKKNSQPWFPFYLSPSRRMRRRRDIAP
jgi:hypothetical protein